MNQVVANALIPFSIFLTIMFALVSITVKRKLKKVGYKVTYMNISASDYSNINKLRKEDPRFRVYFIALLFSTIGGALAIILFLISMIV